MAGDTVPRPFTVGLTGGLASGKSEVARLLAERGAAVLDADRLVHELYEPAGEGAAAVARLFGPELLTADGSVDRPTLAAIAVRNGAARKALEAAVHPLVRKRISGWVERLGEQSPRPPLAVVEAALLVETGTYRDYDALVVVWCRPELQLERARERGMPEPRARLLLATQLPIAQKLPLADVVIENNGSREQLAAEVERAWHELLALAARA